MQIFYAELIVTQYFICLFWKIILNAMTITDMQVWRIFYGTGTMIFLKTVSYFLKYVWFP